MAETMTAARIAISGDDLVSQMMLMAVARDRATRTWSAPTPAWAATGLPDLVFEEEAVRHWHPLEIRP